MKKRTFLSVIILMFLCTISSCSKDNPSHEPEKDQNESGNKTENPDNDKEEDENKGEQTESVLIIENGILKGVSDKNVTSIILPDNIKTIAEKAFENSSIVEAVLNEGLESIEENGFAYSKIKKINFPSTLKKIGNDAFLDCIDLEEADLSKTKIETINEYAFYGTGIKKAILPENLNSIADLAFAETPELIEITIPKNVKTIGTRVFYKSGITKLTLNNNLEKVEYMAFGECKNLTSVLHEGESSETKGVLGNGCFQDCTSLKEISIPECFSVIEGFTFIGCNQLVKITLPKSLKEIGTQGLKTNFTVETIVFKSTDAPVLKGKNVFPAFNKENGNIIIPKGSKDNYKEKWGDIFIILESKIKEEEE